ncbi:hypothetical protein FACS1894217_07390 [Clostridia bacterium]|nr:hypothetical protein FACS1894217_07390 [Clostridia bacterium]
MARPKTKTTSQSVTEYIKRAYDRVEVKVPKGISADFKKMCAEHGTNPNRLINEWIKKYLETCKKPIDI